MAYVRGLVGDIYRCRTAGKAILELGSYNVNGTVRELFAQPGRYVGVDWRAGPSVDHVCLFHDIPWVEEFDFLVSCNAFEHDPHWRKSIAAGVAALKPGGEILLCMAGPGYPAHEVQSSPEPQHYANIDPKDLAEVMAELPVFGVMTEFASPQDIGWHGFKRRPA